jgi:methylase of polypeptide subunit release factors
MGESITPEICRGQGEGDSLAVCRRYVVRILNFCLSLNSFFYRRASFVCSIQVVIVENQPFGHLNLYVRQGVFIPRWETEEWSIALAARLRKNIKGQFTLVDLCSGSGCIPLLLKSFVSAELEKGLDQKYGPANPLATFVGIEKSPIAAEVSRLNLKGNNLHPEKRSDGYPLHQTHS